MGFALLTRFKINKAASRGLRKVSNKAIVGIKSLIHVRISFLFIYKVRYLYIQGQIWLQIELIGSFV